ncbi:hypothetical protein J1N35_040721, partial [Gossypium stocksii]
RANTMYVVCHSHPNLRFQVTEYARPEQDMSRASYHVNLPERTCDCGRFQVLRFLSSHVISTCTNVRIKYTHYINECTGWNACTMYGDLNSHMS